MDWIYRFPFQIKVNTQAIDDAFHQFARQFDGILEAIRSSLNALLLGVHRLLVFIPWWGLVALVIAVSYIKSRRPFQSLLYGFLLFLIGVFGLWELMLTTLSIVLAAVVLSLLLGFPLGILISMSQRAHRFVRPVLDTMQTMPVFVYLIPAVILFKLGRVPAVIATTIYAIVPIIRLTDLGIRQVDPELVEAVKSFGATRMQALIKVQIPQALPTIMTGVNQTLMMAMAMVVTTSMIGTTGLGLEVLYSVNRVEVGRGLISGSAVVILAIILDRLSQGWFDKKEEESHE